MLAEALAEALDRARAAQAQARLRLRYKPNGSAGDHSR